MSLYNKILNISKTIAIQEGINAINMRAISNKCDISLGSIYNYFPSKSSLIINTIESIWEEIFNLDNLSSCKNFIDTIVYIFNTSTTNLKKYPNFFTLHSFMIADENKEKGRDYMNKFLKNIKLTLVNSIENDKNIKNSIFDEHLTKEIFVDYIFTLLLDLIFQKNANIAPLLTLIKNTIY